MIGCDRHLLVWKLQVMMHVVARSQEANDSKIVKLRFIRVACCHWIGCAHVSNAIASNRLFEEWRKQ